MLLDQDTIAAIATSLGEASVGIVRVSGPGSWDVVQRCFRLRSGSRLADRRRGLRYGRVVEVESGAELDECLLLWMPCPHSYTAEDVAEFQVHGGIQLVQAVLRELLAAGARLAEPGEFTKRAFLNGRMDLSQAEAVIDLIRAKTELASKSALEQVKGGFGERIRQLRKELIHLQAHVEVTIDYPEHDVESVAAAAVMDTGGRIRDEIQSMLERARFGQILREGVQTAIVGRPNVGKSSLMNALLEHDRAIVTDIPGTTRDVLEAYVNVEGVPFKLMDTAGIRDTVDIVEQLGVERSLAAVRSAQFVLVVLNASEPLAKDDHKLLAQTSDMARVIVLNKVDLVLPGPLRTAGLDSLFSGTRVVETSLRTMQGMADLRHVMVQAINVGEVRMEDMSYLGNARQVALLKGVREDLDVAVQAAAAGATLDVVAVQLQSGYAGLGLVIGEEAGEDLLDEIFSNFCLGK